MRRLTVRNVINKTLQSVDLKLVKVGRVQVAQMRKILFIHVPKCGGSSVIDGLQSAFGLEAIDDRRAPFRLDDTAAAATLRQLGLPFEQVSRLLLRYALERLGANYVAGHFYFDNQAVTDLQHEWTRLTTLRDPKKHILSFYYFNRFKKGNREYATELTIEEWLETANAKGAGMAFVRIFVGDVDVIPRLDEVAADGEFMRAAVTRAIENLATFTVVGDSGDMPGFENAIADKLGVRVQFDHINTSPAKSYPSFEEHSAAVQRRIEEISLPNQAIYDHFFGRR